MNVRVGAVKRTAEDVSSPFPILTFSLSKGEETTPSQKRTRYNPDRRSQVQRVRKRGACLRCRLMKISCSDDDLCTTCLRAASFSYRQEKHVLGFIGCVRTSLLDVSVFPHGKLPSLKEKISETKKTLIRHRPLLAAHKYFLPGDFVRMIAFSWSSIGRDKDSSSNSQGLITMPVDIPSFFYTLVYHLNVSKLVSLDNLQQPTDTLSNSPHPPENRVPEITQCFTSLSLIPRTGIQVQQQNLGPPGAYSTTFLGQKCLSVLEHQLKPTSLSKYSSRKLRSSFMLIFGVILLVATAEPAVELPPFPEEDKIGTETKRTLFDVLQLHLCNMLVHYLTFLGSKLGLLDIGRLAQPLKVKDLNESIVQWEQILLRWILQWQTRNFDRGWLKEWASVQKRGVY